MSKSKLVEYGSVPVHVPYYEEYGVQSSRWYVLAVFSAITFWQSLVWLTFSAFQQTTMDYYGVTANTVNFWLALGALWYLASQPLATHILSSRGGVRKCALIGITLVSCGCAARCIPLFIPALQPNGVVFVYIGQSFIAIAGPLVMSPVSQLSCLWFDDSFRSQATTIATVTNTFGSTVGFPFLANLAAAVGVPGVLSVTCGVSFVLLLLTLIYFPAHPRLPPSAAATKCLEFLPPTEMGEVITSTSKLQMLREIRDVLMHPSAMIVALDYGIVQGIVASAWTGQMDGLVAGLYGHNEDIFASWLGFACQCGAVVGGYTVAIICDKVWKKKYKLLILLPLIVGTALMWMVVFMFPSFISETPLLPNSKPILVITTAAVGVASGGVYLGYECAAELTFPVPEGSSASVLAYLINIFSAILLIASFSVQTVNFICAVCFSLCTVLTLFVKEDYKRHKYETEQTESKVLLQ